MSDPHQQAYIDTATEAIKGAAEQMRQVIRDACPDGLARASALLRIDEAVRWAVTAMRDRE